MLVGDGQPPLPDRRWGRAVNRLAPQLHVAAVWRQGSGRDRHQSGLSCAVLAEEGVDLAGPSLERDPLERIDSVEAFPYVSEPQHPDILGCDCHSAYSW